MFQKQVVETTMVGGSGVVGGALENGHFKNWRDSGIADHSQQTHTSTDVDTDERIHQDITGGRGVDVAVEALGYRQTFTQCVQSVRDGGKAVMIGLTLSGAKWEVDINHLI